jgi:hypothetical protein
MNRQNAQYELKIIVAKKSLLIFAVLFKKNTLTPKVMEIALANRDSKA